MTCFQPNQKQILTILAQSEVNKFTFNKLRIKQESHTQPILNLAAPQAEFRAECCRELCAIQPVAGKIET